MVVKEHGRGADQVSLRLPPGLRGRIKEAADENGRSMNAEIIALLEEQYPDRKNIGEFVETWLTPIVEAKSEAEKDRLVEAANKAAAGQGFQVRAIENDGRYAAEAFREGPEGRTTLIMIANLFRYEQDVGS